MHGDEVFNYLHLDKMSLCALVKEYLSWHTITVCRVQLVYNQKWRCIGAWWARI